jgi:hypothetical protein
LWRKSIAFNRRRQQRSQHQTLEQGTKLVGPNILSGTLSTFRSGDKNRGEASSLRQVQRIKTKKHQFLLRILFEKQSGVKYPIGF